MSARLVIALCAALLFASVSTVTAQQLTITGAHPDAAAGVLVIDGTGFRAGVYVGIAGRDLTVLGVTPRQIRAALPALPSGSYRLVLKHRFDTAGFIVTIGAIGPAGPQGLTGPSGVAGAPGLNGALGSMGPVGPRGPVGSVGPEGPVGPMGLQGPAGVTALATPPGLTVIAPGDVVVGTLVGASTVMRQDNGMWVNLGLDSEGVTPHAFPIFYEGGKCTGAAYAYFESYPAPLVRSVQRMSTADTTGYYPGNPPAVMSFPSMQIDDPSTPGAKQCLDTALVGWSGLQYVGPLQTIDLSLFIGPFTIR